MAISETVKKRFVKEVLEDEAKRFIKNQGLALRKQLQFHTSKTFNDRSTTVTSPNEANGKLSISLKANIRFLDIKKKGAKREGKSLKRRKQFHLYNRFAYGHYFHIGERLMFELTDDVVARIKSELTTSDNG